ncbi:MAG: 3-oxoacyl-[acyl-carrier-protein] reductase [Deferribacteraceae bacterium]|jgi:3-oxoacyl-[acyl-carrier protein] reductase|nr:3-oxoacyl-[acyl-carrier-protein] reductase [Deferribacteraceae bacterium]
MTKDLKDKVALVTGASRGIGKAIAFKLAAHGAKVIVNYARSSHEADEVVAKIKADGGDAIAMQAKVNDPEAVKAMFDSIEKAFGAVDILVNNAGITKDQLLMRMSDEDFDTVIDTNLKGTFYCTRQAVRPMMKKKYGKIINLSSVVGFAGNAGQLNYIASKAGIHGMTKAVATEMGAKGIRVNTVAPGFVQTEMTDVLDETIKKSMVDKTLLKTFGTVDDVANAVYFLASPMADYITGQVIHVNGGMYL